MKIQGHMPDYLSYRRILYRMGYYDYQRGLIYHNLDEHEGWKDHLKRCREFILKAVNLKRPSVLTVLGSGWLLDFPLAEVAGLVSQVNLVDIVHPPEVKDQITGFRNVVLREEDITGGLVSEVWKMTRRRMFFNKLRSLQGINIPEYNPGFEPGMVISLNILTQLESMPVRLLKKKAAVNEESYLDFRKKVQQSHLGFLKKHESVLITDLAEIVTGSSGRISTITSVLADLPAGEIREEWTWLFDLRKSDFYSRKSVFNVTAIIL